MKTNPLFYGVIGLALAVAIMLENFFAAAGFTVAMVFMFAYDATMARVNTTLRAAQLFIDAHQGKWPSRQAEAEAAEALARFTRGNK